MNDTNQGQVRMAFRDGFDPAFRFEGDELRWDVANQGDRTAEPGEVVDIVDVYPAEGAPWRLEARLDERVEPGTAATNRVRLEGSLPDGAYTVRLSLQQGSEGVMAERQFVVVNGGPTFDTEGHGARWATGQEPTSGSGQGVVMAFRSGGLPDFRIDGTSLCWDIVNNGDRAAEPAEVVDLVDVYPASGAPWRVEAAVQERVEPGTAATNRISLDGYPDGDYTVRLYLQSGAQGVEAEQLLVVRDGRASLDQGY